VLLDPDLASFTAIAVYAVLWGFIFAECGLLIGFFLPGDTILFAAGLLAGSPHSDIDIWVLATGTFIAAVAGNQVAYALGRRYGRDWLERRRSERIHGYLVRAEAFYARYGLMAVVSARWIPWVRAFVPTIAGAARMPVGPFTVANIAGALPWAFGLPLFGYFAYAVPSVRNLAAVAAGASILFAIVAAIVVSVRERRRRRSQRAGS
jgi:membrane-associated protein